MHNPNTTPAAYGTHTSDEEDHREPDRPLEDEGECSSVVSFYTDADINRQKKPESKKKRPELRAETSLRQNKTRPRWFRSGAKRGTTTGKMEGKLAKKWRSRESPSGGEGVGGIERKWFF